MRNDRLRQTLAATIVACAGAAAWSLRDHVLVNNFRVVESGAIYRGAEQKAGPLRRLIRTYGIRTIVCLVDPAPDELAVAKSLGVRWLWAPLGDASSEETFDILERLAGTLDDPANWPVFVHCRRGVYRSNLAQAVYRMKSCGWTVDQALSELRTIGFDPEEKGGDSCCEQLLTKYYQQRILDRPAAASGEREVRS